MSYPFNRTKTEVVEAVAIFQDFFVEKLKEEIDAKMIIDMVEKSVIGDWSKNYICMDSLIDECFNSNLDGMDLMWGENGSELRGKDLKDFVRWMFKITIPGRDWILSSKEDKTSMNGLSYVLITSQFKSYHCGLFIATDKSFYVDESQPIGMPEIEKPLQVHFQLDSKKFDIKKADNVLHRLRQMAREEYFEGERAFMERMAKEKADFERDQAEKATMVAKRAAEKALNLARVTEQISAIVAELQKRGFPADHEKCRRLIEDAAKIVIA